MTTHKLKRCEHCQTPYSFQSSGHGASKHNDDRYCPDCMKSVMEALKLVRIKFEKKWLPTTDYTKEQIITAQKERIKATGPTRRIVMGLTATKNGILVEIERNVCEQMEDPTNKQKLYYLASWWDSNIHPQKVMKEVWYDVNKKQVAENQCN
jgi:hypothetical protein